MSWLANHKSGEIIEGFTSSEVFNNYMYINIIHYCQGFCYNSWKFFKVAAIIFLESLITFDLHESEDG